MTFSKAIQDEVQAAVLCWLATADANGQPNVSPKEIFAVYDDQTIVIANIASPQTVKNIKVNSAACLSVLDIFTQKGYQLKGQAQIIEAKASNFEALAAPLLKMAGERFPFSSLTAFQVQQLKPILAPSYLLYPDTTKEADQVAAAMKNYGVRPH